MIKSNKVSKIFFSPSGTTEKIASRIANNFKVKCENYDLLNFDEKKEFVDELVIIAIPVFDGHIPQPAKKRLENIKSNNTNAIVIINYGNISYGDALFELLNILKKNNFKIIGIAITVSRHSIFRQIAKERPDKYDFIKIDEFSKKIMEKLKNGKLNEVTLDSKKYHPNYSSRNYILKCDDEICTGCMECYHICPEDAILKNPTTIKLKDCTRCGTCINICRENARSYKGIAFELEKHNALNEFRIRNESEFYI